MGRGLIETPEFYRLCDRLGLMVWQDFSMSSSGMSSVPSLRRASQHLQFDGLRYALEANRRRAFRCGGTLAWQLNESYPNAWCTAAVAAYHGVCRAYETPHACAQFTTWAWGGEQEASTTVWAWG